MILIHICLYLIVSVKQGKITRKIYLSIYHFCWKILTESHLAGFSSFSTYYLISSVAYQATLCNFIICTALSHELSYFVLNNSGIYSYSHFAAKGNELWNCSNLPKAIQGNGVQSGAGGWLSVRRVVLKSDPSPTKPCILGQVI